MRHGLRAAANRSGATRRMDGTSVAAGVVSRWAADWLALNPGRGANELRSELARLAGQSPLPGEEPRAGAGRLRLPDGKGRGP